MKRFEYQTRIRRRPEKRENNDCRREIKKQYIKRETKMRMKFLENWIIARKMIWTPKENEKGRGKGRVVEKSSESWIPKRNKKESGINMKKRSNEGRTRNRIKQRRGRLGTYLE